MLLILNFILNERIKKAVTKEGKFLSFFCYLIALCLDQNSVKGVRVRKIANEIKIERI